MRGRRFTGLHTQNRDDDQKRDDSQILKEQHSDRIVAVTAVELQLFTQLLDDDGGGRDRKHPGQDESGSRRKPHQPGCDAGHNGRGDDLCAAHAHDRAAHCDQARQRELQPKHEKQEYHAKFGDQVNIFDIADPAQAVGAGDNAHEEITQDCGQAQTTKPDHGDDRNDQ